MFLEHVTRNGERAGILWHGGTTATHWAIPG